MTDQSKRDQMSDPRAMVDLIRSAVKFANLAAGEGISIDDLHPEDFMMAYSDATGFDDWDNLDSHAADALTALMEENKRLREALTSISRASRDEDVAALVAATRRQVRNIEHWLDGGRAAGPSESQSIYQQMKDALEPFGGTE